MICVAFSKKTFEDPDDGTLKSSSPILSQRINVISHGWKAPLAARGFPIAGVTQGGGSCDQERAQSAKTAQSAQTTEGTKRTHREIFQKGPQDPSGQAIYTTSWRWSSAESAWALSNLVTWPCWFWILKSCCVNIWNGILDILMSSKVMMHDIHVFLRTEVLKCWSLCVKIGSGIQSISRPARRSRPTSGFSDPSWFAKAFWNSQTYPWRTHTWCLSSIWQGHFLSFWAGESLPLDASTAQYQNEWDSRLKNQPNLRWRYGCFRK